MKLKLEKTPEQYELIKAMASKDLDARIAAQEAFAGLVGPVIAEVMAQAPILANFYTNQQYDMGTNPMLPVDTFFDVTDYKLLSVWSQVAGGGLGTNEFIPTVGEMPVRTYTLDSAISFDSKYAVNPRMGLDVVAKTITRLMQEILNIQENYSVGPLMSSLANAVTSSRKHVQRASFAGRLLPEDFNKLITLGARLNTSWSGGTPVGGSRDVTDLLMSPEMMEQLRSMAYNPINTAAAPYTSANKDSIPAPEDMRKALFNSADIATFYGKTLHVFNEFGKNQRFNTVFDTAAGSTTYAQADGTTGAAAFDGATEEIIVGIDRARDPLLRLIATDSDTGSEFSLVADDQFYTKRAKKVGWYGSLEEGRLVVGTRALVGLIS